jgi:hypothetical protein
MTECTWIKDKCAATVNENTKRHAIQAIQLNNFTKTRFCNAKWQIPDRT